MSEHKKTKKMVSKQELEHRYKIWTLVIPVIASVTSSAATVVVALINSQGSHVAGTAPAAGTTEPGGGEVAVPYFMRSTSFWPAIIVLLVFLCIFFAAKFIGHHFVTSHYELAQVDEGEESTVENSS
jgi:hypothetical protein